jgi:PAS domain S-box-containing protein
VSDFLRQHKDEILSAWETRVGRAKHEVELTGLALRDDIPGLLDELAAWLASEGAPETSLLATSALGHVLQRLDQGLPLGQVFREYRLLRETIIEKVLGAEAAEQERAGAASDGARIARIVQLARLNAGLDVVLSQSVGQFVEERDRRAAAERASAAQAVRESETQYRALFDSIDEGFCIVEVLFEEERPVDYRFLRVNPAFERHTGLKDASFKRIRELVPGHDQHWFETYGRVAQTGEPDRFEDAAVAPGRFYDVYAFRVGAPEQRQVAVLFNDITKRKRAEESLRVSERQTAFQLELSDALRPLSDAAEIHSTVTRMARDYFEADRCYYCEIEGDRSFIRQDASRDDLPSVVGEYRLDSYPIFRTVVDAGRPVVVEDSRTAHVLDEELKRLCLEMQILSFLDVPVIKDGRPVGILCITSCAPRSWTEHDVMLAVETAERTWVAVDRARAEVSLREANERLLEADRRKNEFLAVLSHELRNPLAPIRNSVYILERAAPGGEQAVRAREVIDRQAQHMARLIDDLLDVTRVSRGKIVLQRERVDLAAIARGTAEDHRETFARDGVDLEVLDPGKPLWVEGDRTRLAQVVGNLLTNSAKFTPRGGRTVLTVEAIAKQAVVRVRDDGAGMSPETLENVFEPFVQAAQPIERSRGGLGLGLALVKELVQMHGGTVAARSEGEGRGSEFVVSLPLQAAVAAAVDARGGPVLNPRARRVLVVEDNLDSAESLREALSLNGHEVAVTYSGPAGLEAARSWRPEVVLCDVGLPGIDGYEVARAIRRDSDVALRRTFLVALSGYALSEDVIRSREAGFDRHVAKPPSIEALESVLEEAAARPERSAP